MSQPRHYRFNLAWPPTILSAAFLAGLTAYLFYRASHSDTLLRAILIPAATLLAILTATILIKRAFFPAYLELNDKGISFPHGWFNPNRHLHISFNDIIRLFETCSPPHDGLHLNTPRGRFDLKPALFET